MTTVVVTVRGDAGWLMLVLFDIEVYWRYRRRRLRCCRLRGTPSRSVFPNTFVRPVLREHYAVFSEQIRWTSRPSLVLSLRLYCYYPVRVFVSTTRRFVRVRRQIIRTMPRWTYYTRSAHKRKGARVHVFSGKDAHGHRWPKMICYMPRIQVKERLIKFKIEGKQRSFCTVILLSGMHLPSSIILLNRSRMVGIVC